MSALVTKTGFHNYQVAKSFESLLAHLVKRTRVNYAFANHFHPYVGELIERLTRRSVDGLLDVKFHAGLVDDFFAAAYAPNPGDTVSVTSSPADIDVGETGPYAVYNWELLFHVPFTIAVHLSKNQRFAQAQTWFHYIFDPTSDDQSVPAPERFWKFLRFRQRYNPYKLDQLLALLSKPADECTPEDLALKDLVIAGYEAIRDNPFQPHAVARTRVLAYQYAVVMKYIDNLVAWGDSLFRQDTIEAINEATQLYVLAANILGERPQQTPPAGVVRPRTYAQLREAGIDRFGNALVELEGQFPFNLALPSTTTGDPDRTGPLFGLGHAQYFCVPPNDKLLGYWDLVADRLFKIRHCMNIEGVVRQLPLFEPPIDPGLLVQAAAAGIDVSSLVSGLNQPLSPVRASLLIGKALEICAEVRSLGTAMLGALEKQDAEALSLLRQGHEIHLAELAQDVRFLQWKEAEEQTAGLLRARETAFDRYRHYQLLLGRKEADIAPLGQVALDRAALSEATFADVYQRLVGAYAADAGLEPERALEQEGSTSPQAESGARDAGDLNLVKQEFSELNVKMPAAHDRQQAAVTLDTIFGSLGMLPNLGVDLHFWGLGGHVEFGGPALAAVGRVLSGKERGNAETRSHEGTRAGKVAGYRRRNVDWVQQSNAAAHDLMQNGRQLISALIREQITKHEYDNHLAQLEQSRSVDTFLRAKFTSAELYGWMQGELAKQFYDCYRFAFDVARQAEQTMKHDLLRPELDDRQFIKFGYWDGGRRGLLAGESLYLDVKRMELAYHDHNKREYELTRHVSLAQLDPVALLRLRATGGCLVTVPEWLYDLDTPGHYLRRIKSVGVTIPAVTGPYTSVHATVSLLGSSVRRTPLLADGQYLRAGPEDARFLDYTGNIQSIVTSTVSGDSGLFETNLRDERYLPFEGAGAVSTWKLELPASPRTFDYATIPDVIMHVRYTAREGGAQLRAAAQGAVGGLIADAARSGLVRLLSLRYDFPSDWYAFTGSANDFTATLTSRHFPYFVQGMRIAVGKLELYAVDGGKVLPATVTTVDVDALSGALNDGGEALLTLAPDSRVLVRADDADVYLLLRYTAS